MNVTPVNTNTIQKTTPNVGLRVNFRANENKGSQTLSVADTFEKQKEPVTTPTTVNKVITSFKKFFAEKQPQEAKVKYLSDKEIQNWMYDRGFLL